MARANARKSTRKSTQTDTAKQAKVGLGNAVGVGNEQASKGNPSPGSVVASAPVNAVSKGPAAGAVPSAPVMDDKAKQ